VVIPPIRTNPSATPQPPPVADAHHREPCATASDDGKSGCAVAGVCDDRDPLLLDGCAVEVIDEFLGWLTGIERSPNTVEAYARDLGLFWSFLDGRGVVWDRVSVVELGEFAAWARRPAENVLVLRPPKCRLSACSEHEPLNRTRSLSPTQRHRQTMSSRSRLTLSSSS
jgi:hypothetical protein